MHNKEYGLPKEIREQIEISLQQEKDGKVRTWEEVRNELERKILSGNLN